MVLQAGATACRRAKSAPHVTLHAKTLRRISTMAPGELPREVAPVVVQYVVVVVTHLDSHTPKNMSGTLRNTLLLASLATTTLGAQSRPAPATTPRPQPAQTGPNVLARATVRVMAALLLPDLTMRPVPLHSLEFVATLDSAMRLSARTGVDGTAAIELPIGQFRVRSVQAVTLNDTLYRWDVLLEVPAAGLRLDLTNVNATASVAPRKAVARQVAPEREVFEAVKRGVFRIEAGLGHGSGFLAALPGIGEGLVITNDHVVATSTTASVYLDSVTRVPAVVVARDRDADLAILRLPAGRCAQCPKLPLSSPAPGEPLAVAGERVFAIGFPLNQEMTLTTGIVSSLRDGALISDVNINHGNSGGPMLSLAGEVVGVNAFGDFTSQGGPGISGAIAITRMRPLLEKLPAALAATAAPHDRLMPSIPQGTYTTALMRMIADTVTVKSYRKLLNASSSKFEIEVSTPVMYRVAQRMVEAEVGADRRKRETRSNVTADEQYSELKQNRDWEQYVGSANTPVVTIAITPKIGETFMSALGRGLLATNGTSAAATMTFSGDVRGARFYRNGVEVEPIRGGHGSQVMRVNNAWVTMKDVADWGYYVLAPEAFAPDSVTGAPARVLIVIQDLKNPTTLSWTEIEGAASARVWNDFGPYFASTATSQPWRAADANLKSPKFDMDCVATSGQCVLPPPRR